jgi:predicted CopG family antitoxin
MKIDLQSIDREQFMVHEHIVNGETLSLVQPQHIGCKWSQANKHFRSSVWNSDGELVSAGFPKFTNWGENPEHFPVPSDLNGCTVMEKLDGSLLIVSKYKGNYILRTRGTVDARQLDNGYELDVFESTVLPKLNSLYSPVPEHDTWRHSYLFEWTSPVNKIVLSYGDNPEWTLVGIIDNTNYSLEKQGFLDTLARQLDLKRPATYVYGSVDDLLQNVELWKGKEGVCVYSKNDQMIHKVKGAWYLALHHMKSELASFEKVIDVWFNLGKPTYTEFYKRVSEQFDFELANQIQGDMSRIADGYKEVEKIVAGMNVFVNETLKKLPSRKEQALKVLQSYGETNRASFIFKLLDGKTLADDDLKKLLYQVLKK